MIVITPAEIVPVSRGLRHFQKVQRETSKISSKMIKDIFYRRLGIHIHTLKYYLLILVRTCNLEGRGEGGM